MTSGSPDRARRRTARPGRCVRLRPCPLYTRLDPLCAVEEKVAQGERLSADDGLALFESHDLLRVGRLADQVRRRKVGDDAYFVVNRHINYTNVCRNRCRFCAFSRVEGEPGAYTLTVDEVVAKAREAIEQGATEIHIVGGENPTLPYSDIRAMVSAHPRAGARGAHQGLHRVGDRLLRRGREA